jgi:hypothetical protein
MQRIVWLGALGPNKLQVIEKNGEREYKTCEGCRLPVHRYRVEKSTGEIEWGIPLDIVLQRRERRVYRFRDVPREGSLQKRRRRKPWLAPEPPDPGGVRA